MPKTQTRSPGIHPRLLEPLRRELAACRDDPNRYNDRILCRAPYWSKQREICESIVKFPTTCVKTGNAIGKSYLGASIPPWFATTRRNSKVIVAAPTIDQLQGVIWSEMEAAAQSAAAHGRHLGGRLRGLSWTFGPNWMIEGHGSGSIESKSGRHAGELMAIVDEASGVDPAVLEALDSLNPSKRLYMGNPIRPEGKFYELCELSADNPNINVIHISSLDSPHIHLARSPWGLADATFIENMRHEYGEDSMWWQVHILGLFPGELDQALLPRQWLEIAAHTIHVRSGPVRLGVDIAKGNEGDLSLIAARDDNGIIGAWGSRVWSLEELAAQVRIKAIDLDVQPIHVVYDSIGVGTDFENRLKAVGIRGAKPYMGSNGGGERFANLRSTSAWAFRRRLDPARSTPVAGRPTVAERLQWQQPSRIEPVTKYGGQPAFAIPRHLLDQFRRELQGCKYSLDNGGRITLERKEDFVKRIKVSPNFLDAVSMTFAFPHG